MKKIIVTIMLVITLALSMIGCAKKSSLQIAVEGIGNYEVVQIPTGFESFSKTDNYIAVTVKKDGDYDFVLQGDDGKEYSFTLKYHDGNAEVETDDDTITINLAIK